MRTNKNSILIALVFQCHKAAFVCTVFLKKINMMVVEPLEGAFYPVRLMEHMVSLMCANRERNESLTCAEITGGFISAHPGTSVMCWHYVSASPFTCPLKIQLLSQLWNLN